MLGASPPFVDDAVDLVAGAEVLAEEADGHLGHDEGVAGVDALLGGGRGVGVRPW